MQDQWVFWAVALVLVLGCLLAVFAPLLRGRARSARRASYDMQIYRDQLREVEADRARGVLSEEEAEATRTEVSRRLLAAADAETAETAAGLAPRRVSTGTAVALIAGLVVATGGLYATLGAPGLPDQPLAQRMARLAEIRADRPSQAEAEAMIAARAAPAPQDEAPEPAAPPDVAAGDPAQEDVATLVEQLEAALADRPDDLMGHQLLARSLAGLGRFADAGRAQGRVVEIMGEEATAEALVGWAEYMIFAVNGYVSPEAEAALARAIAIEPSNPLGLYYTGRALVQNGRPDLAYRIWSALLDRGPPDAPWVAAIAAEIDAVAQMAGLAPRATPPQGPSEADMEAARDMAPEDRQAMIEGMVAQLSDRLAREGGPAEDWVRLIRSLAVLGRRDEAAAIAEEARGVFAQEPAARDLVEAAVREAGIGQ